jgi:organic radical activating enzyme
MKQKLDEVGCGFCLAKWTQVTLHLQNGHTHSCHHPNTHKVPLDELKDNPSALHNTQFKKELRKEMLENGRPEECVYCWNIEDNSEKFSDRIFKSADGWSLPSYRKIKKSNWDANFNPRYVEVLFSNACNQKCSYCSPNISSAWMEEINQYGGYPTSDSFNNLNRIKSEDKMPIPHKDPNPYVDAFWEWWPDLYRDLHTFRITGGEPLLSKDTFKVLDYIIEEKNPNRKLNLAVNSNLTVPDELIDEFIDKVNYITTNNLVNSFVCFTSADTWGEQAEYTRNGMGDFEKFWSNCNKVLSKCEKINLTFMCTYNALSVTNFKKFIAGIYKLKCNYWNKDRHTGTAVVLDISYLRFPKHQSIQILPKKWGKVIKKQAQFMDFLSKKGMGNELYYKAFTDVEVDKMKRIYDWFVSEVSDEDLKRQRKDFHAFFSEHDKRRGTDFITIFPELSEFYEDCKYA